MEIWSVDTLATLGVILGGNVWFFLTGMDCNIGFKEIGYKDFLSVVSTFLDLDSATEKTAGSETRLTF